MTTENNNENTRLIEFLLGALPAREAAAIESERERNPVLKRKLDALERDMGAVRDGLDLKPSRTTRAALLAAAGGGFEPFAERVSAFLDLNRAKAGEILHLAAKPPEQWSQRQAPGVWTQPIRPGSRHREADAFLLWVAPGAEIPRHRHRGTEWGFVLAGQLADDAGDLKSAGDIVHNPAESVHRVWNPGSSPAVAVNVVYSGYDWHP